MAKQKPEKLADSEASLREFLEFAWRLWQEHKHVTFSWKIGADCSLSQKALFHIWLREYAAHLLKRPKKEIGKDIVEGFKYSVKQKFYLETAESFMVYERMNPWHPDGSKKAFTSCSDWLTGEMFMVLEWLQNTAANDGLILVSTGEFAKNKAREQG